MSTTLPTRDASYSRLFNPAGGIRYHWRAFRHSQKLWRPFRSALARWLLSWQPRETTLLLIGSSAGYNLPLSWLGRFERLTILEPDPVARFIFRRRLARTPLERPPRIEFIAQDHVVFHPDRLGPLLATLDQPALLFSNLVGQLPGLLDIEDREAPAFQHVKLAIQEALHDRSWASFHDRVSGTVTPVISEAVRSPERWSDRELLASAYNDSRALDESDLIEHLTAGFFPEALPHLYLPWQLEPGVFHLIEAVFDRCGEA